MKGREGKGAPPTDLLVCFPSRAHLTLMPKAICSPARPLDETKRHNNHHHHLNKQQHHHHRQLSRSSNRGGQASPLLWAKSKPNGSEISEPTSPKVTCAGQIKVRSKTNSCKNWQSVMEEIERLHKSKKHKKKPSWAESFGFKKDAMQFLACLRGLRFDFRCFGSFHGSVVSSDDEDDDDAEEIEEEDEFKEEEKENRHVNTEDVDSNGSSTAVFSKWFMVLEENQDHVSTEEYQCEHKGEGTSGPCVPPSNALLLMRCRSAPAKSWLEEKQEQLQKEQQAEEMKAKLALDEEKRRKDSLILKCYAPDFFKVSSDIAKETWVVGGTRDPFSRSRSWKR